ncbi:hypothetical protein V2J09_009826 [Rumex salicifolius]
MEVFNFEKPYVNPELESLFERVYPPRVCVDNDAHEDCTVVKVDSVNKRGILLEMVQVLTDLKLVISKSYICSDGGWFMDVFHVTDQNGNKVTDDSIIHYTQEALGATRSKSKNYPGKDVRPLHLPLKDTTVEISGVDRPGLLSEVSAALANLGCQVTYAVGWTHNARAACIIYVEQECDAGPIRNMAHIQEQLEKVVEAHHQSGEKWSVRLVTNPVDGQKIHPERRLHQLMLDDKDYESCCESSCFNLVQHRNSVVKIETCKEKGYSVVNIRCRDRPRLLFDTVCVLTDLNYVVFHAAISSSHSMAFQEYYIRNKDGWTLDTEAERHRVEHCLIAAIERSALHGLQLDFSATNRPGLLSDVTKALHEHGLSVSRAEIGIQGEKVVGTFYIVNASKQNVICSETVEEVMKQIQGVVQTVIKSPGISSQTCESTTSRSSGSKVAERPTLSSIGSLVWSRLGSFSTIRCSSFVELGDSEGRLSVPLPDPSGMELLICDSLLILAQGVQQQRQRKVEPGLRMHCNIPSKGHNLFSDTNYTLPSIILKRFTFLRHKLQNIGSNFTELGHSLVARQLRNPNAKFASDLQQIATDSINPGGVGTILIETLGSIQRLRIGIGDV